MAKPECGPQRVMSPCEVCRTINLAKHTRRPKPDMQLRDKPCIPIDAKPCPVVTELPLTPTTIKICTKEEFHMRKTGQKKLALPKMRPVAHGKFMYLVKAGLLAGAAYWTYRQGVWGSQRDVTECLRRWAEYIRSLSTRKAPDFDMCGKVIRKDSAESILTPAYTIYKNMLTSCFAGIAKVPLFIKCAYVDYLKAMEKRAAEDALERKIKRNG